MKVFENGENKASDIELMDLPFICRICLRRCDSRLFEQEDYLLDLFVTITKIDVRSKVNFPRNICNECISELEDISLFINASKYNDARHVGNLIPKIEYEFEETIDCGTFQDIVVKIEKTTEEYNICVEKSEKCRICLVPSCLTPFEEKAHLMQLFQNITNIDLEAASNFSCRNRICSKCINKLESISLFISLSLSNDMKIESTIGRKGSLKTEICSEESAIDFSPLKGNDMKFDNISETNELKVENHFKESACSYQSKYLHTVVDIKEEILHSPEALARENDQEGLEFASETNSVEILDCDPYKNKFSTENHQEISHEHILKVYMVAHTAEKPYKCEYCEKSFSLKGFLNKHMLTHTVEKPFKCDGCGKSFKQKHFLKLHMVTHTGEKPFKCDVCAKCFSRKSDLKKHILTHQGEKSLKCGSCEERFNHKQSLKTHMLTHTLEKPFKCEYCEKSFRLKRYLKMHLRIHTGEKPFECDCCKKTFNMAHNLKQHMVTHTGEKAFKCDVCQKCYSQKGDLNKHVLAHTGEKTFKCDICDKSFYQKQSLGAHMRTHTGEKSFKCNCCEKSYFVNTSLKRHMLLHTRTEEKLFKFDGCEKS